MHVISSKKHISLFLVFLILASFLLDNKIHIRAAGKWVISDDQEKEVKDDIITWIGIHNAADPNVIRYRTVEYRMSRKPYDTDKKFTSGSNASIDWKRINVSIEGDGESDGIKVRTYSMSRKQFIKAANELGIDAELLKKGPVTVYLNPVYETYQGENTRKRNIFGLQEMLSAEAWSSTTRNLLPQLYNVRYTITMDNIYNIDVIAVDTNGNELAKLRIDDEVIYNQAYDPEIEEDEKTLNVLGTEYHYINQWSYEYEDRETKKVKKVSNLSSDVYISHVPDANWLTIYMVYDKADSPPYKVDVIAETEDGKKLTTFVKGDEVKSGTTYKFKPSEKQKLLQDKYYYSNKWYLTYTDNKMNKLVTTETKHSEDISQVMPDAKAGSTATFHLIYGLEPGVTPAPDPDPGWEIPTIVPPLPDHKSMPFTTVSAIGSIRADDRGNEKFVATLGVPTTESLYGEVKATDYLIGYNFTKKVGLKYYPIKVTKNYILLWDAATPEEELEEGKEPAKLTETVTIEQIITVPRAYGYWEIENLDYYNIQSATLNNYALPNGSINITPNSSYYNVPSINYYHSSSESYHIIPPTEAISGITLPAQTITGGKTKPTIPKEDFTKDAYTKTGNIKVRSDRVVFNGVTVMSDTITETEAPNVNVSAIQQCYSLTNENVLYKPGQIIEATKENGDYGSTGKIVYYCRTSDVSSQGSSLTYPISGINNVIIHTPVLCDPIIEANNNGYVQLIDPDNTAIQLVLDKNPNLSDFTVRISNTGLHSNKQGYYTRDFSRSLRDPSISYIQSINGLLRNEVKFPFDVYIDKGNDGDISNDEYIKAGSWIVLGRSTARFYLPMWVNEGIYEAEFRTVAVNCVGNIENSNKSKIYLTEEEKNTNRANYVATNTVRFEVSGRVYGLTIYDLTDYPIWEEAFRVPNSADFKKYKPDKYPNGTNKKDYNKGYYYDYALGTKDPYGNDTGRDIKYTFPLVNGSHPYYTNQGILKTGYMVRFSLETTGNMFSSGNYISIKPSFYFVDKDGKNRKAVDLYYSESFNGKNHPLVKVGSKLDQTNIKSYRTGDINHGIPESELRQTADILKVRYGDFIWNTEEMFTFSNICLRDAFRTFIGNEYANIVKSLPSYKDVKSNNITEANMIKRTQRWYGAYYIPNRVYAVEKDFDVFGYSQKKGIDFSEDFWLKDGYIIVNLRIETMDQYGNRRLSYINPTNYQENGNCSMWVMEGPPLEKKSYKGPTFKFYAGDFLIYYANKRASDDYSGGAIY